jgi:predicted Ser/Thr protein kinase
MAAVLSVVNPSGVDRADDPGTTHPGDNHVDLCSLPKPLRSGARRGNVDPGVSGAVQARSSALRQRRRTDAEAIGEPELVDTRSDHRLSRIFANKMLRRYPAFRDLYGMEEVIEHIVSYFRHAAQGLEEKKQILYLLGPVGGGKSTLAEKLKYLIERVPFYAIKGSPVHESPLGLFNPVEDATCSKRTTASRAATSTRS